MKRLSASELPRLRNIGREFTTSAKLPGEFCETHFEDTWAVLLESNIGVIFYEDDEDGKILGVLGGLFHPDVFSGRLAAAEQFLFVLPEARGNSLAIRLLNAFQDEAVVRKCSQILMVSLAALDVGSIFLRRGYVPLETVYTKEI